MKTATFRIARSCAFALLVTTLCAGFAAAFVGRRAPFHGGAVGSVLSTTPTPAGLELVILAMGHATQLGDYVRAEQLVVDGTGHLTGQIEFVAENGDRLYVAVTGSFVSATNAVGTYTIVGGTGRFANASGTADFQAVSPDGIQMSARFLGTLIGG